MTIRFGRFLGTFALVAFAASAPAWADHAAESPKDLGDSVTPVCIAQKIPTGLTTSLIAFSPDGSRLATTLTGVAADGHPTTATKVFSVPDGKEIFALEGPAESLHFSNDGKSLFLHTDSKGGKSHISKVNLEGRVPTVEPNFLATDGMAPVFAGNQVIFRGSSIGDPVRVIDLSTGKQLNALQTDAGRGKDYEVYLSTLLSSDGKHTALLGVRGDQAQGFVKFFDNQTNHLIREIALPHFNREKTVVSFLPDGSGAIVIDADQSASPQSRHISFRGGEDVNARLPAFTTAKISPSGKEIALVNELNEVILVDANGKETARLAAGKGSDEIPPSVEFSADGNRIITRRGDDPGEISIWDSAGKAISHMRVAGEATVAAQGADAVAVATPSEIRFFGPSKACFFDDTKSPFHELEMQFLNSRGDYALDDEGTTLRDVLITDGQFIAAKCASSKDRKKTFPAVMHFYSGPEMEGNPAVKMEMLDESIPADDVLDEFQQAIENPKDSKAIGSRVKWQAQHKKFLEDTSATSLALEPTRPHGTYVTYAENRREEKTAGKEFSRHEIAVGTLLRDRGSDLVFRVTKVRGRWGKTGSHRYSEVGAVSRAGQDRVPLQAKLDEQEVIYCGVKKMPTLAPRSLREARLALAQEATKGPQELVENAAKISSIDMVTR